MNLEELYQKDLINIEKELTKDELIKLRSLLNKKDLMFLISYVSPSTVRKLLSLNKYEINNLMFDARVFDQGDDLEKNINTLYKMHEFGKNIKFHKSSLSKEDEEKIEKYLTSYYFKSNFLIPLLKELNFSKDYLKKEEVEIEDILEKLGKYNLDNYELSWRETDVKNNLFKNIYKYSKVNLKREEFIINTKDIDEISKILDIVNLYTKVDENLKEKTPKIIKKERL